MKAAIVIGSDSDWPIMKPAVETLKKFGVEAEVTVASAHRTPAKVEELATTAPARGVRVFIAAAGGAAHLAGVVASHTTLPAGRAPVGNRYATSCELCSICTASATLPPPSRRR